VDSSTWAGFVALKVIHRHYPIQVTIVEHPFLARVPTIENRIATKSATRTAQSTGLIAATY
jgi:hypothetical protein